jgi:membrane glycosyltransferase
VDIVGAIKAVFAALAELFGLFKDRQLINAGKAEAQNDNAQTTLDTIAAAHLPITDDDRQRVWARLQAKYGAKPGVSGDPGAGSK